MIALGIIEGPRDGTALWLQIDWIRIRRLVGRFQARIVKVV
jgi:RNA-directed DNA polymerase